MFFFAGWKNHEMSQPILASCFPSNYPLTPVVDFHLQKKGPKFQQLLTTINHALGNQEHLVQVYTFACPPGNLTETMENKDSWNSGPTLTQISSDVFS